MTEYGIFNDEGLVEGGFYARKSADAEIEKTYSESGCYVAEICHDHEDQEREHCEICNADDEENEDDDE